MRRTVTVTGYGSSSVVPDAAVVRVAATGRGRSVDDAVIALERSGEAVSRIAHQVAEERDVATTGLQVWPRTDDEGRQVGFEASHRIEVRCPDLALASTLLSGLVEAVGDDLRVEHVGPVVGDTTAAQREARERALADARDRATHLAGLTGATLADVLEVVEGEAVRRPPPMPRMALTAGITVEPGEQEVTSAVTVTWQLA